MISESFQIVKKIVELYKSTKRNDAIEERESILTSLLTDVENDVNFKSLIHKVSFGKETDTVEDDVALRILEGDESINIEESFRVLYQNLVRTSTFNRFFFSILTINYNEFAFYNLNLIISYSFAFSSILLSSYNHGENLIFMSTVLVTIILILTILRGRMTNKHSNDFKNLNDLKNLLKKIRFPARIVHLSYLMLYAVLFYHRSLIIKKDDSENRLTSILKLWSSSAVLLSTFIPATFTEEHYLVTGFLTLKMDYYHYLTHILVSLFSVSNLMLVFTSQSLLNTIVDAYLIFNLSIMIMNSLIFRKRNENEMYYKCSTLAYSIILVLISYKRSYDSQAFIIPIMSIFFYLFVYLYYGMKQERNKTD